MTKEMKSIPLNLRLTKEYVRVPKRNTLYSAGYDVFSQEEITIAPFSSLECELPFTFSEQKHSKDVEPILVVRSSYGIKKKLRIHDGEGHIPTYNTLYLTKDTQRVWLYNDSEEDIIIPLNEHFLQIVFTKRSDKLQPILFECVTTHPESEFHDKFQLSENQHQYFLMTKQAMHFAPKEEKMFPIYLKGKVEANHFISAFIHPQYGGTLMFSNVLPIVDSDYYNNPKNEGLIYISLKNQLNREVVVHPNQALCYFWAKPFYVLEGEEQTKNERSGGIGSTSEPKKGEK